MVGKGSLWSAGLLRRMSYILYLRLYMLVIHSSIYQPICLYVLLVLGQLTVNHGYSPPMINRMQSG